MTRPLRHVTFVDADRTSKSGNRFRMPTETTGVGCSSAFIINVPAAPAYEAIIDPKAMTVTRNSSFPIAWAARARRSPRLALGPFHHLLVSACGNARLNANDGSIISQLRRSAGVTRSGTTLETAGTISCRWGWPTPP